MADRIITGIDIGSSKTSVVIAKLSENEDTPRVLGFSSSPSHGVRKGQIVDINKVSEVVEESVDKAERMAGTKVQSAYVSIGGPHIESLNSHGVVAVSNPDVEIVEDDVVRVIDSAKAISISSTREVIEVIPREYIVDGQSGIKNPIGMSGVRLEVDTHIITANKTNLKNTQRCLSDLGINVSGFVFSGLASSLSAVSETEKELGVVLIDVGGGKIDLCIYVEGALSYSASVPVGDRHIVNDIAVGLRISLESAEKIRLLLADDLGKNTNKIVEMAKKEDEIDISKLILPEKLMSFSYKAVVEGIIRPRVEEMFEHILSHVEGSGYITQIPSGAVVTGGGAQLIGIKDTVKRIMGMPVRVGVPGAITGLIDEVMYPQYTSLVGLLLYGQEDIQEERGIDIKNFDKIFRSFSIKSSFARVTNIIKSFIP